MKYGDEPVAVYIPTKNRAHSVKRAIYSILYQSFQDIQIIVVDDGSTDETPKTLSQLQRMHPRLTVVRNSRSYGACEARNQAIEHAKTQLLCGLDDDDLFLPTRIASLMSVWSPGASLIGGQDIILNSKRLLVTHRPSTITTAQLLKRNCFGNQGLFRKVDFDAVGGFNTVLTSNQDYDLWIRLSFRGRCLMHTKCPTQIVFDEYSENRITNREEKSAVPRAYVMLSYRDRMTLRQRSLHLSVLHRQRHSFAAIVFAILGFDFSKEGFLEIARSLRAAFRRKSNILS